MPQISMPQFGLSQFVQKLGKPKKYAIGAVALSAMLGMNVQSGSEALADDSVFLVAPVMVQEQAASEVDAKKAALSAAKRKAFGNLVKMLVPVRQQAKVPQLEARVLENLIYTTDIPAEQMSQGEGLYVADIQIGFRPDLVREFFQKKGIAFAETPSRPLLVLPVMTQAGGKQLWEDTNEWRLTWAAGEFRPGLVPITQPLGDLSDMGAITAKQALELDPLRLKSVARKYGAAGVLLSIADVVSDPSTGGQFVSVSNIVFADGWDDGVTVYDFETLPGQGLNDVFAKAISVAYNGLQERWKESNLIDPSARGNMLVFNAPLTKLSDWISIRTMLEKLAMVQSFDLIDISIENAHVAVEYNGRTEALQSALAQSRYALSFDQGDQAWFLARQ